MISNVFDQSPQGIHLGARHNLVNASQHPIFVKGGVPVYGMVSSLRRSTCPASDCAD